MHCSHCQGANQIWCMLCCALLLQRLLGCEGVKLEFTPEAIQEIAAMAEQINKEVKPTVALYINGHFMAAYSLHR